VHEVEVVVLLVALATVVAVFARHLRVPAPSVLVVAGLIVGLLPEAPPVHIPPDVVSLVVLPPLLYAASGELSRRDLRAVWRPVVVLAVGLVLASAAAVAVVAAAVASLSLSMAFVLGAILASTDPVAVGALARRLSLPVRVQTVVQAESLFNDGTSLAVFAAEYGEVGSSGASSVHDPDTTLPYTSSVDTWTTRETLASRHACSKT
jgi:monovalent cation/hydrogen antiporter